MPDIYVPKMKFEALMKYIFYISSRALFSNFLNVSSLDTKPLGGTKYQMDRPEAKAISGIGEVVTRSIFLSLRSLVVGYSGM